MRVVPRWDEDAISHRSRSSRTVHTSVIDMRSRLYGIHFLSNGLCTVRSSSSQQLKLIENLVRVQMTSLPTQCLTCVRVHHSLKIHCGVTGIEVNISRGPEGVEGTTCNDGTGRLSPSHISKGVLYVRWAYSIRGARRSSEAVSV